MKNSFLNKNHQLSFEQAIEKLNKSDSTLMAAVYLLTADYKLWKKSKKYVEKNRIRFDAFKPVGCTEKGYTFYCAAQDVYLDSKHFTLSDLADKNLILPKMFDVICTAVKIKRCGVDSLNIVSAHQGVSEPQPHDTEAVPARTHRKGARPRTDRS